MFSPFFFSLKFIWFTPNFIQKRPKAKSSKNERALIKSRCASPPQYEEGPRTRPRAEPAEAAGIGRPGAAAAAAGSGRRRRRTGQPTAATSAAPQRRRPSRRGWEQWTGAAAETVAGGAGPHGQELPAGEGAGESRFLALVVGAGWDWVPTEGNKAGGVLIAEAGWTRSIFLAAILRVFRRRERGVTKFSSFVGFDR